MYAKIYKEIFIENYTLKKHLKDNIWVVRIDNAQYYLSVYEDTEEVEDFSNYSEAELLSCKFLEDTFKRIEINKKFYQKIKEFKKTKSYLFRSKNKEQACLFNFDTFVS